MLFEKSLAKISEEELQFALNRKGFGPELQKKIQWLILLKRGVSLRDVIEVHGASNVKIRNTLRWWFGAGVSIETERFEFRQVFSKRECLRVRTGWDQETETRQHFYEMERTYTGLVQVKRGIISGRIRDQIKNLMALKHEADGWQYYELMPVHRVKVDE